MNGLTRSPLSQHERVVHLTRRNEKRKEAAQPSQPRPAAKGYGKIWSKEDIDRALQLEQQFKWQTRIAKEMTDRFPGKTAKQIRDKRKEAHTKHTAEPDRDHRRANKSSTGYTGNKGGQ